MKPIRSVSILIHIISIKKGALLWHLRELGTV
nr:MAG TPA: hypothetical protein [Caudoviricetes sp.]